jgi:hypothetical protein
MRKVGMLLFGMGVESQGGIHKGGQEGEKE